MGLNITRKVPDPSASIGATTEAAAATPAAASGLHGLIAGFWTDFRARIPSLVGGAIPVTLTNNSATSVTLASVSVTNTSAVLFASNTNRIFWSTEYKSGTGDAYVTEGATATTANGRIITLDTERVQDIIFTGAINVIGTLASTCTLGTTEYVK